MIMALMEQVIELHTKMAAKRDSPRYIRNLSSLRRLQERVLHRLRHTYNDVEGSVGLADYTQSVQSTRVPLEDVNEEHAALIGWDIRSVAKSHQPTESQATTIGSGLLHSGSQEALADDLDWLWNLTEGQTPVDGVLSGTDNIVQSGELLDTGGLEYLRRLVRAD
jgi:hypothetical protein